MRLYAETERDFFLKEMDAQITFQTEGRRPATDENCRCPGVWTKKVAVEAGGTAKLG